MSDQHRLMSWYWRVNLCSFKYIFIKYVKYISNIYQIYIKYVYIKHSSRATSVVLCLAIAASICAASPALAGF